MKLQKLLMRSFLVVFALLSVIATAVNAADGTLALLREADSLRSSSPIEFQDKLKEIEKQAGALNNYESEYLAYLRAYNLSFSGQLNDAYLMYQELAQKSQFDEFRFRALTSMVNTNAIRREWTLGLENLRQTIEILPTVENIQLKEHGLAVAAVFYNYLEQHALAKEFALQLSESTSNQRSLCFALQLRLQADTGLGTIGIGDELFQIALQHCETIGELVVASAIVSYKAELLLKDSQASEASQLLDQYLERVNNTGYPPIIASFYTLLAEANLLQNKKAVAAEYATTALKYTSSATNAEAAMRANKVLFDYHSSRGNSEAALEAYIKYAEADKAYLDEVKTKTLAFQLAEHQSLEQQNKIALLDEQNKLLKVQQQLDTAERFNSRLMIGALLSVILGLITWGWHSLKNQRRLKQLAEYDSLTGLLSRGHFTQVAQSALTHAQTLKAPVSCVLFDVDHFKRINDCFGHATGDWALKQVASLCREQVREFEIFGRIGGEEFCLILPECDSAHARVIADKLRRTLASCDTSASGNDFVLTASFGLTDSQEAGYSLDQLLAQADRAMYSAKRAGRNQVKSYSRDHDEASVDQMGEEQTQAGDARTQTSAAAELGHSPIR